jgi:hypothetical protein
MSHFPLDEFVDILLEIWPSADFPEDRIMLNDLDMLRDMKLSERKKWLAKGKRLALRRLVQERIDEISEAVEVKEPDHVDVLMKALPEDLSNFVGLDERQKRAALSKAQRISEGRFDDDPVVYFVGSDEVVKIGYTTNFSSRYKALKTSSPVPLKVYLVLPGARDDEQEFHEEFSSLRVSGEWFRLEGKLLDFLRHYSDAHPFH